MRAENVVQLIGRGRRLDTPNRLGTVDRRRRTIQWDERRIVKGVSAGPLHPGIRPDKVKGGETKKCTQM